MLNVLRSKCVRQVDKEDKDIIQSYYYLHAGNNKICLLRSVKPANTSLRRAAKLVLIVD